MKVFLAAFECDSTRIGEMEKVKPYFVLGSFYYLNKLKPDILKEYMDFIKQEVNDFILDSGAFSMLNSCKGNFLDNLDGYINAYISFINKYDIKHFIELDIDKLVGYEKVKEIRKKIEIETGKKKVFLYGICQEAWKSIKDYVKNTIISQ